MDVVISKLFTPISDRRWFIRALEILPGAISWSLLALPVVLSLVYPVAVAYFIIAFDLYWLMKSFGLSSRLVRGYRRLRREERLHWRARMDWIERPDHYIEQSERAIKRLVDAHPGATSRWSWGPHGRAQRLKYKRLAAELREQRLLEAKAATNLKPSDLYHAIILATYKEGMDILEPSVKALTEVDYDTKRIVLIIAYEERGGEQTERNAHELVKRYGDRFAWAQAIKHPDGIPGEVIGKGGNITWAGRELAKEVERRNIDPEHVVVTTLDSDHRAGEQYFSYLSYAYATNPNRSRKSYQPIPMFFNNIWDVPAPMRVIATNNSFWLLMETMRPHRLRNFAAHAQGLKALLETDFWSVSTIVEDGHQFWRSYFAFDGDHEVVPLFVPVYQDAVLSETYFKTWKAQYKQIQRWAWGASDVQYVIRESIKNPRIPLFSKLVWIGRLMEGHISWATASLLIAFVAWLPLLINPSFQDQILAHQLPQIASGIMNLALIGAILMIAISMMSLPPRPAHYHPSKRVFMVLQWVLQPLTAILFGSLAALDAQTRLMLGRYLQFNVTEKNTRPGGRWAGGKWVPLRRKRSGAEGAE